MCKMFELYDPRISMLKNGEFAIPVLKWDLDTVLLVGEAGSINKMATHLINSGRSQLINEVKIKIGKTLPAEQLLLLIKDEIESINHTGHYDKIFDLIQLWGGVAARQFYINGFNIDVKKYSHFVSTIISTESIDEVVQATQLLINDTSRFNIAFATKHVSIWQRFSRNSRLILPIYDSIMALNIMGRYTKNKYNGKVTGFVSNDYKNLKKYWLEMKFISEKLNVPINNIERQLFNFFRGGTPASWPRKFL